MEYQYLYQQTDFKTKAIGFTIPIFKREDLWEEAKAGHSGSEFHMTSACIFPTTYLRKKPNKTQSEVVLISQHDYKQHPVSLLCTLFHRLNEAFLSSVDASLAPNPPKQRLPFSPLSPPPLLQPTALTPATVLVIPKSSCSESTFYSDIYIAPRSKYLFPVLVLHLLHPLFLCGSCCKQPQIHW